MPWAPATPCRHPGCPKLSHDRYCPEHTKQERKRYDQSRSGTDKRKKYSSTKWRALRIQVLQDEPLCRHCKQRGIVTASNEVDHIDGDSSNDERGNLQALCHSCHSRKTAQENQGFGNG